MSGRPIGEQEQAPAACLPYDPRAQEVARKVARMINHQLPDITVDHVGSTAVPGCAGKGVIELRAFRDRLRANPEMMEAYVQRKRDIIEGGTTDALDYSIVKGSSSGKRWPNGAARTDWPRAQISRGVPSRKRA
jgi:GrpB-like predicted nucleotidyltransferase (UPF0157 family)